MLRMRAAGVLAVVALLLAACGDGGDIAEPEPQPGGEDPAATRAEPGDEVEAGEAATASTEAPAESVDPEAAAGEVDVADAVPIDAGAVLSSATTALEGRSVRGEAIVDFAPGLRFSTRFESDTDGDLAALILVPPGTEPEFPAGAEAEIRYVDGVAYVRPPVTDEELAELGVDEAWYVVEPALFADPADPIVQVAVSAGLMCIFPQVLDEVFEDCDPLGDSGTLVEAAREAEIVGREDLGGVKTTRVRFVVSLLDLAVDALGMEPDDDGAPQEGAFDDSASDPFAEGMEQIFGFLDADFEVEAWIDDDSLIRRLAFDLASMFAGLADEEEGLEIPSSPVTVEFHDFDADISVDAPPPEVVVDEDLLVGDDDYATSEQYEPPQRDGEAGE